MTRIVMVVALTLAGCGGQVETCAESLGVPAEAGCAERPGSGVLQCVWSDDQCRQSVTFNADTCEPLFVSSVCH